jgi:hypothetical protein
MSNTQATSVLTPEQLRDIRARAWAFVFKCWQEKKAAGRLPSSNGPDAKVRSSNDSRAYKAILPK